MTSTSLVQLIKHISMDAMVASKPCDYITGTVVNENPLEIKISQTIILDETFLHLSRNVTDYEVSVDTDGVIKKYRVLNHLKKGETVLLLRKQKGQEYAVIDRSVV